MTREEAIVILENEAEYLYGDDMPYNREAFKMAIKALQATGEIKEIINISNFVIQEDVLKYKMICEVVEKMNSEEEEADND